MKPKLTIQIHDTQRDYHGGNFLNAIDEVCCFFWEFSDIKEDEAATLLEAYIKKLRGE